MNGQKVIDLALSQVGITELPPGSNKTKYGEWFGWNGVEWCAIFASWCYAQAGFPLGNVGFLKGFSGVETGLFHWTKTGELTKTPHAGDIFIIDFNGDGKPDHTGLFVKDIDGIKFESIEGNTSKGNQANGGQVQHRFEREYSKCVFIHPKVLDLVG